MNKKVTIHRIICNELNDLYIAKNNDYGDSYAKLREEFSEQILIRIYDKYLRVKTLMMGTERKVNDESIEDSLMDLANYCIMELIERKLEEELNANQ